MSNGSMIKLIEKWEKILISPPRDSRVVARIIESKEHSLIDVKNA